MDYRIRQLEKTWLTTQTEQALFEYAYALIRSGNAFKGFWAVYEQWDNGYNFRKFCLPFEQSGYPPLAPPMSLKDRFDIDFEAGSWHINDHIYGNALGFAYNSEAYRYLYFIKQYVTLHGDIDLDAMPDSLEDPLRYDNLISNLEAINYAKKIWTLRLEQRH